MRRSAAAAARPLWCRPRNAGSRGSVLVLRALPRPCRHVLHRLVSSFDAPRTASRQRRSGHAPARPAYSIARKMSEEIVGGKAKRAHQADTIEKSGGHGAGAPLSTLQIVALTPHPPVSGSSPAAATDARRT